MKKILSFSVLFLISSLAVNIIAAPKGNFPLEGKITDQHGNAVEFATIVLTTDKTTEVAATIADAAGTYKLDAPAGEYLMTVQCLGYETYTTPINVINNIQLENIVLNLKSHNIGDIVVQAPTVIREADRFVMNVAGTSAAIGKDAAEMLKLAPGVWITEDKLSINGREGVVVMVDERVLRMSRDELNTYLRSIPAEDIAKIEVIPYAGAEYDADSQSGIIKITLKRQRRNGIEGSVDLRSGFSKDHSNPSANISLDFRRKKLSLYGSFNYSYHDNKIFLTEKSEYLNTGVNSKAAGILDQESNFYYGRAGIIYDISDRQSIGAEVSVSDQRLPEITDTQTEVFSPDNLRKERALYDANNKNERYSIAANYINKLDTLGSVFKVIADYSRNNSDVFSDYNNGWESYLLPSMNYISKGDTLYRSTSANEREILSVGTDISLRLSPQSTLKAGAKYIYNHMDDNALYEGFQSGVWSTAADYSLMQKYTENIGAAYGVFNSKLGKITYQVGLRGEYTHTRPNVTRLNGNDTTYTKDFFSLFPNANISVPLNEKQSNSLILAYSRKISRPSFWAMNPFKVKINEYTYIVGDPFLRPSYINDFSVSLVLSHKYNFSAGMMLQENSISQVVMVDPDNPDMMMYKHSNVADRWMYYISLNAPVNITSWMTLNTNLTTFRQKIKLTPDAPYDKDLVFNANINSSITLPKKFYIDAGYFYMSSNRAGNMVMKPQYDFNFGIKKRFMKDRFTASFNVYNILDNAAKTDINITGDGFRKNITQKDPWNSRRFTVSLRYTFRHGIKFKTRNIEKSGDDSRM